MASAQKLVEAANVKFTGWKDAKETLKDIRDNGTRESRKVTCLGKVLVTKYASKLGEEVWTIHEQLVPAALDVGDMKAAENSFGAVKKRFPDSQRVKRLEGLLLEANAQFSDALDLYDELLTKEPTSLAILKRKVAIHKAMGDNNKAITELVKILETYMTDAECWAELADLYIKEHSYDRAAFCIEELILINPHNYQHHQRYAEVCYSQKTPDSLITARKHFSTALKLNPGSTRSLYGLRQTALHIANDPKLKIKKDEKIKSEDVLDWTGSRLQEIYQDNRRCLTIVEQFLKMGK